MVSIVERKLVWWRDVPIDVEIGLLKYLSMKWKNEIYVICANDYELNRKHCGWEVENFANVHFLVGDLDKPDKKEIIEQLLAEDNVNIFSGIKGGHRKFLNKLTKNKNGKCIVVMESTSIYGSKAKVALKKLLYPVIYGWYYTRYRKVIAGLFAMGEKAVKQYLGYGWKNIFDFMYLPSLVKPDQIGNCHSGAERVVKLLYIGRFDFATKGVHILMDAIDKLDCTKHWQIDLVGGYGAQKDEVLAWCRKTERVEFVGSWDAASLVEKMKGYDFCVVPSIYDGWNLTPLQAIHAGIGCIITDNAGSQELVRNSGAGVIVRSNDSEALAIAIQNAIENPDIVEKWKSYTRGYVDKVSDAVVGEYFIQGMKYCYGEQDERPKCPW